MEEFVKEANICMADIMTKEIREVSTHQPLYPWINMGVIFEDGKFTFYREYVYPNKKVDK